MEMHFDTILKTTSKKKLYDFNICLDSEKNLVRPFRLKRTGYTYIKIYETPKRFTYCNSQDRIGYQLEIVFI